MPVDLSAITAEFPASERNDSFARRIRQSELDRLGAVRFLHDQTAQELSAAGLQLGLLLLDFETTPELRARVTEIQGLLETTMRGFREVSRNLAAPPVGYGGLRFALESLARDRSIVPVKLHAAENLRVPPDPARALHLIAAAALAPALVSDAKQIDIYLIHSGFHWVLEVLYDIANDKCFHNLTGDQRLALLALEYEANRGGVHVELERSVSGYTVLRASYSD